MARNCADVNTAVGRKRKMRLLTESVPWEHEKRTLSARLQCRGVCMCACLYLNTCIKLTSSHFVLPHILE